MNCLATSTHKIQVKYLSSNHSYADSIAHGSTCRCKWMLFIRWHHLCTNHIHDKHSQMCQNHCTTAQL